MAAIQLLIPIETLNLIERTLQKDLHRARRMDAYYNGPQVDRSDASFEVERAQVATNVRLLKHAVEELQDASSRPSDENVPLTLSEQSVYVLRIILAGNRKAERSRGAHFSSGEGKLTSNAPEMEADRAFTKGDRLHDALALLPDIATDGTVHLDLRRRKVKHKR